MYFRIVAENISDHIFNRAQKEGVYRGTILRTVKKISNKLIIHCRCESQNELNRILTTLETDNEAFVSLVENSLGEFVPFRDKLVPKKTWNTKKTLNSTVHTLNIAS